MTHDPLCPWAQENVFDHRGECYLIEGSEPPINACQLIAKVRADERSRKGTCWREADGSQIPSGAIRVYREAGWFWEMP